MSEPEKKAFTVRLPVDLYNEVQRAAVAEGRSVNNLIERRLALWSGSAVSLGDRPPSVEHPRELRIQTAETASTWIKDHGANPTHNVELRPDGSIGPKSH